MAMPALHLERSTISSPPVHLYIVDGGRPCAAVYRRRRLAAVVVLLIVMVVALALSLRVGAAALGGGPASAPEFRPLSVDAGWGQAFGGQRLVPGGTYVAQPGDTLWAIARAMQPTGDLDRLVDRLVRLNGGPSLAVGERVRLPG